MLKYPLLRWIAPMLILGALLIGLGGALAQDDIPEVWVTTQRNANLRTGPGTGWDIITTLPFGTTLRATGRVFDWVQVLYTPPAAAEPIRGWLWRNLLIWTGDINSLPLDGVDPEPFIRVQSYTLTLTPDMAIYRNENFGIGARLSEPLPCTEVEFTGRLGQGEIYWLQFWCSGAYYWVSSVYFFNFELSESTGFSYFFGGNNFSYTQGDLVRALQNSGTLTVRRLNTINDIWTNLANGMVVSCAFIPAAVPQPEVSDTDLAAAPEFAAPFAALRIAIDETNAAIDLFGNACIALAAQPVIDPATISAAQAHIATAQSYLYVARQFVVPLANRDPYASGVNSP
ncbi:MAG: SH3 domain-containing protein [Chloroflexi bacterium]|nr:SH3 domain-containing protein [Chloroflexota bacterium]